MQSHFVIPFVAGVFLTLSAAGSEPQQIEDMHRLFDMAPISATNPVLARVKECGIEIPASEFRVFVTTEGPLADSARTLKSGEKRELLEHLIDEHLLLWNAYQQKWDQKEGVVKMVNGTL